MSKPIVIVGAGISGCVLAQKHANSEKKVIVIEKRNHIGGNCYDYINIHGIRISKYGAHLFHTNHEEVWDYVKQFSNWYPYKHKVLSDIDGKLVPIPVNITTVNKLFGLKIKSEKEMKKWLSDEVMYCKNPRNSKQAALSRVGPRLYKILFEHYTKKQWDMLPEKLEPSVLNRIPIRTDFDTRYFTDKYQYLPTNGYTALFETMLKHPNIQVELNNDYFKSKYKEMKNARLYFTGPIDKFFEKMHGHLQYRSLKFEFKTYEMKFFQNNSVVNYPGNKSFTRIVEYKHFSQNPSEKSYTTISREYGTWKGEEYYPVPNQKNKDLYEKYRLESKKLEEKGVYFVGRLANYKYFNMDQAFKNALDLFNLHEKN